MGTRSLYCGIGLSLQVCPGKQIVDMSSRQGHARGRTCWCDPMVGDRRMNGHCTSREPGSCIKSGICCEEEQCVSSNDGEVVTDLTVISQRCPSSKGITCNHSMWGALRITSTWEHKVSQDFIGMTRHNFFLSFILYFNRTCLLLVLHKHWTI